MARVIEVSIKERADEVVALFNANRPADAVALLERHRQGQPEVVQESMDRYVSTQAERSIAASAERAQVPGHAPGRPIDGQHGKAPRCTQRADERQPGHLAKEQRLAWIHHVLLSNRTPRAAAGATVFVVQGEPSNPADLRASMPTDVAVSTPVEQSLAKLQELDARTLAQVHSQAQERGVLQEEAVKPQSIG
ncbi:XVIPCD domain-containing protein [Xanthomonas campestris]|uniref:XVIPCD domain-containing protein n=1 Tax=Xanthomonas campestris TaxID=339 RepID=UPI002B22AE42|nr:XVIPCD domain-containing protein [Xanthomonas campestris]MEA9482638.1 XVIPCD domain-containing protein [Xanthomonas campestris]